MGIRILAYRPVNSDLALRLTAFDGSVYAFYRPAITGFHPTSIKPELHYFSIFFRDVHQFVQLLQHVCIVLPVRLHIVNIRIDFPVPQRVIQSQLHALFLTFPSYGFNHIRFISRTRHVIISILTVPKTKALMMFCHQNDILHTGIFRCLHPLTGVNLRRGISFHRERPVRPFHIMERIDTKMNEHTILALDLIFLVF